MTQALGMALDAATLVLLTSYGLSALITACTRLQRGSRRVTEQTAWWRVVAPPLGGVAVVVIGFGSALWDAWMVTPDHCGVTAAHQPYLCWPHPAGATAASVTESLAVMLLVLVLGATLSRVVAWLAASRRIQAVVARGVPADATAFRRVLTQGGGAWRGPITVVRTDAPICCVTGVFEPRLLISTAVVERLRPADIALVVAHERAHLERRDLPRRLTAHLLTALHAPGLGKKAVDAWALAAEMACDQAAARGCGSPIAVAETLVRFRRTFPRQQAAPMAGAVAAFAGAGELETRVRNLLDLRPDDRDARNRSRAIWLVLAGAAALTPGVHVGLETLLRLLHA